MSDRKALLDRMAHRTAPVESSLFDVAETPPAPVDEPSGEAPAPEATAAAGSAPRQPRNRPVAASGAPLGPGAGPEPAPGPAARSVAQEPVLPAAAGPLIQVYTAITSDAEEALHRAAFDGPAGGEGQKSRLVREAIDALLADYDAADAAARAGLRERMRRRPDGVRITRYYRIEAGTKERLSAFGRDERIPSAAALREAIERRFGPSSG